MCVAETYIVLSKEYTYLNMYEVLQIGLSQHLFLSLSFPFFLFTHPLICMTEFTIRPEVGPDMPLVIPEGGGAMLTCTHERPPFTLTWFRETTAIREGTADTLDECGCEVPRVDPGSGNNRTVTFMEFAQEFAGEYSCRAPIVASTGTFDICRFRILLAGEQLRNHSVCVCPCMYMHLLIEFSAPISLSVSLCLPLSLLQGRTVVVS